MTDLKEIWKDIPGFEGVYQVSDQGRVKSLARKVVRKNGSLISISEKVLKPFKNGPGYLIVHLHKKDARSTKAVHQLVAMAFLGHEPCGMKLEVDHKNNCRTDNYLDNLQLISHRENNIKDKKRGSSQYPGVTLRKSGKWEASISIKGITKYLGQFSTEAEASKAYQKARRGND